MVGNPEGGDFRTPHDENFRDIVGEVPSLDDAPEAPNLKATNENVVRGHGQPDRLIHIDAPELVAGVPASEIDAYTGRKVPGESPADVEAALAEVKRVYEEHHSEESPEEEQLETQVEKPAA